MSFIVFDLSDFHVQQRYATTRVRVRFVEAKNMEKAKEFMRSYYPGAWAIIPKRHSMKASFMPCSIRRKEGFYESCSQNRACHKGSRYP